MKTTIIAAFVLVAPFASTACSSLPLFASPARPECEAQNHVIYYGYEEDDLRASTEPMIQLITEQVAACQKAGGELKSVSIVGFPNRTDISAGGDATAAARGQAVLAALVGAGLPAEKIKLVDHRLEAEDVNQPMRRRAEISVEMR